MSEGLAGVIEDEPGVVGEGLHEKTAGSFDGGALVFFSGFVEPHQTDFRLPVVLKQQGDGRLRSLGRRCGRAFHEGQFQIGLERIDAGLGFVNGRGLFGCESSNFSELGGVLGIVGEVRPFVGIRFDVVEFLAAITIVDIAPALRADGIVFRVVEMGDGGVRPRRGGVAQQRDEAAAFDVRLRRQAAQFGECAEEIDEVDGACADTARQRCRLAGRECLWARGR